jgi:hypothetical protein
MKTKNIVFSSLCGALAVLLLSSAASVADTGGGSGQPITPYARNQTPTQEDVTQAWHKAGRTMRVEGVRVQGSNASRSGYKIGFVYLKGKTVDRPPAFELTGVNERGDTQTIPLANMANFTLLQIERRLAGSSEAVIEIEHFPTLSPADLLATQPTYSVLQKEHSRRLKLRVPITAADRSLIVVGTEWEDEDQYRPVFLISDLMPASAVAIRPNGPRSLWWAIPSVAADPAYPHRAVMKR